ncbi:conjugal transfer protein TrbH (plasmid) [Xenorhabdus bovienii]
MRKFLLLTLLIINLSGCMTSPYGNYASAPLSFDQKMAEDTVKQLVFLYPPAHTRFNIKHKQSLTDAYGVHLVKKLRLKGYAVVEVSHNEKKTNSRIVHSSNSEMDFAYIIDSIKNTNLYRVTIIVGKQTISRAYVSQNGNVYPSVSWAIKE